VKSGISQLLTYGTLARDIAAGARKCGMPAASVYSFDVGEEAELCTAICRHSPPDAAILFKASGRMALGQIVKKIGKEG
jgi:UDP-N-acetylmuramyl pentapeptide synthase